MPEYRVEGRLSNLQLQLEVMKQLKRLDQHSQLELPLQEVLALSLFQSPAKVSHYQWVLGQFEEFL